MYREFKGKRLLYLGGITRAKIIVERARKMGIYVIVADYNEDSPAKEIADEAILVDATDVCAIEKICIEKKIDGIMTGYVDVLLPVCVEISKKVGIPCYITDIMLKMSTDKLYFKQQCEAYNVPVPKTFEVNVNELEETAEKIDYPVFVKPLDASGSRGANACNNKGEFIEKINEALSFSKRKEVTVEELLCGTEFILDYLLIDGKAYLVSMADRYSTADRGKAINNCNLMVLPSKNLERYKKEIDPIVTSMFEKMGFENGVIFMQGYVSNEKISFYEMGCRLGGSWPYVDEYFMKVNPLDMLLKYSVTGSMKLSENMDFISPFFDGKSAIIYFVSNKDKVRVDRVVGVEEVKKMEGVVCTIQYYNEGDVLNSNRLNDILLLAVHIVGKDIESVKEKVEKIYSLVGYYDVGGDSLIAPVYDIKNITKEYV